MANEAYWGYWKHKVEQLWKELEDVKLRLNKLESSSAPVSITTIKDQPVSGLIPVKIQEGSTIRPPAPVIQKTTHEDVVIKALKEQPLNVVDLNQKLKLDGIDETVRDTLFNRLKPLMKNGVVDYDESTQTFRVR
ncbi:MAG: hypothetical protein GOU98_03260 [Candidatus Altiarchaeota archaeon]|nr:hypothetical protein [Candidatus Altiarchaeota archaeon]